MGRSLDDHISEQMLEGYALHQLSGDELAAFEEHLLVCPGCQERLREADAYVKTMRETLRKLEQSSSQPSTDQASASRGHSRRHGNAAGPRTAQ